MWHTTKWFWGTQTRMTQAGNECFNSHELFNRGSLGNEKNQVKFEKSAMTMEQKVM